MGTGLGARRDGRGDRRYCCAGHWVVRDAERPGCPAVGDVAGVAAVALCGDVASHYPGEAWAFCSARAFKLRKMPTPPRGGAGSCGGCYLGFCRQQTLTRDAGLRTGGTPPPSARASSCCVTLGGGVPRTDIGWRGCDG